MKTKQSEINTEINVNEVSIVKIKRQSNSSADLLTNYN